MARFLALARAARSALYLLALIGSSASIAEEAPATPSAPAPSTGAAAPAAETILPATPTPFRPSSLPAAAFARLPFVESPSLSPDGTRLAGFMAINGRQRIAIMSLFDKTEKPVQIGIPDGTQTVSIGWVNDDNILVRLSALTDMPGVTKRFYIYRAIGINRVTGKITKLMWDSGGQNAADLMWVPSNGSSEILMAAQYTIYGNFPEFWPTVYRVDIANGTKHFVLRGREGIIDWNADADGNVRTGMRYLVGSRRFSLLYRGEADSGSFRMIDTADSRKQEELLRPFLYLPGTDHALALHDDEYGRSGIFEVDLLTRADVRTVYTASDGAEVDAPVISADGKELLGASTSAAVGAVHWFDPALAALQAQFDKAVGDRQARIVSFNRDRSRMLVRVTRPDTPGAIYYYDVADGTMRRIANINDAIGIRTLSPVSLVRYKARDGLEIEAVLTLPRGASLRALPIVMLPHGGPWARDGLAYDYLAQFIASRGYAVMQPNFRGSSSYGTEFLRKGEGQMGLAMQDDITDGLHWAVAQGIADPKRACIAGASYGGYAAMWGIVKDPEQYRCAISISGVANLRREVNDFGGYLMSGKYRDDWQRMTPDFAAVSPINAIARIKTPLLLIHGKKDVTVDHGQSVSMNDRMRDAGKEVEFLSLPEADHCFTRQEDREALLGAIEVFLAKHNPAGTGSATDRSDPK